MFVRRLGWRPRRIKVEIKVFAYDVRLSNVVENDFKQSVKSIAL